MNGNNVTTPTPSNPAISPLTGVANLKTGDNSNTFLFVVLLFISALGLTTLFLTRKNIRLIRCKNAERIDKGFGRGVKQSEELAPHTEPKPTASKFEPYKGKRRKTGTGCVSKIGKNLWEGRYSPTWIDGKRHSRNIYAHSLEECEEKLAVMITEMKEELAELKKQITA